MQAAIERRAMELSESYINGNRLYVRDEITRQKSKVQSAALAVGVYRELAKTDQESARMFYISLLAALR